MTEFHSDAERVRALDEAGVPVYRTPEERLRNVAGQAARTIVLVELHNLAERLTQADPDLTAIIQCHLGRDLNEGAKLVLVLVVDRKREALLIRAIGAQTTAFPTTYRIKRRMEAEGVVYLTFIPNLG